MTNPINIHDMLSRYWKNEKMKKKKIQSKYSISQTLSGYIEKVEEKLSTQ